MGGKKQESGKEREAKKQQEASAKAAKDKEDSEWKAAGEGAMSKGQAKKAEEEQKRQEAAARKAELRRLEEEERESMAKPAKAKAAPVGAQKVTKHHLETQKEFEMRCKQEELKERMMAARREVDEETYAKIVEHINTNRMRDGDVDARSVTEALAALGITESAAEDRNPEKRLKASWKGFEEKQMPLLKEEKPGLKMSQYKDLLWKLQEAALIYIAGIWSSSSPHGAYQQTFLYALAGSRAWRWPDQRLRSPPAVQSILQQSRQGSTVPIAME